MIAPGRRSKCRVDQREDGLVGDPPGPEGLDGDGDRVRDADRVRDLDLDAVGDPGGDQVLRDVARGVRAGAVHLRRVLAGEAPAAVARHPAVRVHDDLPAGEPGVAHRAADDEPPRRVHVHHRVRRAGAPAGIVGKTTVSTMSRPDPLQGHVGVVLGRDDDGGDRRRGAVLVRHGDLGLPVGTQVREQARLADLREPARHPVRERDRQRHELRASRGRRTRTSSPGRPRRAPRTRGAGAPRARRPRPA